MPETPRAKHVERALRRDILDGGVAPGERLASERELAERFGVGRSSIREALGRLVQLGLVEVRQGGGAIVQPLESASLDVVRHLLVRDGVPNEAIIQQLLDVHEALMITAVGFAVRNGSEAEIAQAHRHLDALSDPTIGDREYFESLEALVQLISVASRNLVLRLTRNSLRTIWQPPGRPRRSRLRPVREEVRPIARELAAALDARDVGRAQEGVRRLLRSHREKLLDRLRSESLERAPHTPGES